MAAAAAAADAGALGGGSGAARPALAATWQAASPGKTPGFATAAPLTVKPAGSGDAVLTRVRVEWGAAARPREEDPDVVPVI